MSDSQPNVFPHESVDNHYSLDQLLELPPESIRSLNVAKLVNTPPHVLGLFLERLDVDQRRAILRKLSEEEASDVLAEMDAEDSAEVVSAMREWRALKILEGLEPDDATDLVLELEESDRNRLLSKLSPNTAQSVRALLAYDPDTAGGVMTTEVATVTQNLSVDETIEHIRNLQDDLDKLHYVYVIDDDNHLLGVVSIRDLIFARPHQKIKEIMETQIQGVCTPDQDKEAIALALSDLNLYAIPVVDSEGKLLGIVEHDDVIDIIQSEATEDFQRLVGAGPDESIHDEISYSIRKRSPWLIVNLFTALLGALVVYGFRFSIEKISLLAVFMPIVASLAGNTGSQTLAVAIRSLAMDEIRMGDNLPILWRELLKGFSNGILIGFCSGILSYIFTQNIQISYVIFIAMALTMGLAGLVGAFVPLALKRLNLDPAQSSSIFVTAITDVFGFFIFLGLGAWLLL